MEKQNFLLDGTAEVGKLLNINEDTLDADGTGTLSYSWQTSLMMIQYGKRCWNNSRLIRLQQVMKINQ